MMDENLYRIIKRLENFPLIHPEAKKIIVSTDFYQKTWEKVNNKEKGCEEYLGDLLIFTDFFINFSEITAFTFDTELLAIFDQTEEHINDLLNLYPDKKPQEIIKEFISKLPEVFKYLSKEIKDIEKNVEIVLKDKYDCAVPHVKAVINNISSTEYKQSYDFFIDDMLKYFDLLKKELLMIDAQNSLPELYLILKNVFKYYELTRSCNDQLYVPADDKYYLHENFLSACHKDHYITKINCWYYGIQGVLLYKDFDTKASLSPELSSADAVNFAKKLKKIEKSINVLECGIGNGQFGIDFLNKLKNDYPESYENVVYNYCDFSQKLLDQVSERKSLLEHKGKAKYKEMNFLNFDFGDDIEYMRYHELFDDVPQNQIIYKDKSGSLYELLWKFFIKNPSQEDITIINDLEKNGINTEYADQINIMLQKISWEYKLEKLSSENHNYFDILNNSSRNKEDDFFIFNYGVIDSMERIDKSSKKDTVLVTFDYGFYNSQVIGLKNKYYASSFINRNYGASITNDVNYDAIEVWAKNKGYGVRVLPQENYIEENLGYFVVDAASFSSHKRLYRHSMFTRTMFGSESYIDSSLVIDNSMEYSEYLKKLKEHSILNNNLSYPQDESLSNEENIKINNDFYICNVFKRYNLKFLYGDLGSAWLSRQIPVISENLEKLGFKNDLFEKEKEKRDYCTLWVAELTK